MVEIAKKSLERKTGARGLRSIMENVMMDYMFSIPSDDSITNLTIDKKIVQNNTLLIEKQDNEILGIEDQSESKESA